MAVDVFDIIEGASWFTNPMLWFIGAAILVVIVILGIYFKVIHGEKRP